MEQDFINHIIKVATGLSGGVIALVLISEYKQQNTARLSIRKVLFGLFLGLCGAVFLAPIFNAWLGFEGRVATGMTFIIAVFTEFILLIMLKILDSLYNQAPDIVKKSIQKWIG